MPVLMCYATAKGELSLEEGSGNLHDGSKEHPARVLDVFLDLDQESSGLSAVNETMVVRESDVHHRANFNLAVDGDGSIEDGVESEYSFGMLVNVDLAKGRVSTNQLEVG